MTMISGVTNAHFNKSGAENMPSLMEACRNLVSHIDLLTIGNRHQLREHRLCLYHRIQGGRDAALATPAPMTMPQLPFGLFFLNMRAIGQQHFEQVDGGRRGVYRPAVTHHREARQQAGVVDVRVGQQHEIELAHVEADVERREVFGPRLGAALEHAAIDEKAGLAGVDEIAGTGNFAGRAEESNTHDRFSLW